MTGNLHSEMVRSWRKLYKTALCERDVQKLPARIEEARQALKLRARELFASSPNYDGETEAVDDALYALQALENCLKLHTKDRRSTSRAA